MRVGFYRIGDVYSKKVRNTPPCPSFMYMVLSPPTLTSNIVIGLPQVYFYVYIYIMKIPTYFQHAQGSFRHIFDLLCVCTCLYLGAFFPPVPIST